MEIQGYLRVKIDEKNKVLGIIDPATSEQSDYDRLYEEEPYLLPGEATYHVCYETDDEEESGGIVDFNDDLYGIGENKGVLELFLEEYGTLVERRPLPKKSTDKKYTISHNDYLATYKSNKVLEAYAPGLKRVEEFIEEYEHGVLSGAIDNNGKIREDERLKDIRENKINGTLKNIYMGINKRDVITPFDKKAYEVVFTVEEVK